MKLLYIYIFSATAKSREPIEEVLLLHITSRYVNWVSTVYDPVDIFMKERDSSVIVITNAYLGREIEVPRGGNQQR